MSTFSNQCMGLMKYILVIFQPASRMTVPVTSNKTQITRTRRAMPASSKCVLHARTTVHDSSTNRGTCTIPSRPARAIESRDSCTFRFTYATSLPLSAFIFTSCNQYNKINSEMFYIANVILQNCFLYFIEILAMIFIAMATRNSCSQRSIDVGECRFIFDAPCTVQHNGIRSKISRDSKKY